MLQNTNMYEILIAAVLGIIQGFTEFLPISSSGHLNLAIELFHVKFPLAFEILLHLATLFAVLVYTLPLIILILTSSIKIIFKKNAYSNHRSQEYLQDFGYVQLLIALIISTLITAPIGFSIKNLVINASNNLIGMLFFITAIILSLPFLFPKSRQQIHNSIVQQRDHINHNNAQEYEIFKQKSWSYIIIFSIILGIVQGGAIFPGISRSGSTITAAVLLGLYYKSAVRYAFLMSIPAILASFIFSISDLSDMMTTISYPALIISMVFAFLSAIVGLRWLSIISQKGKIWIFSIYLIILGTITLIL